MSSTLHIHDVEEAAYVAINVPESKGPEHVWKRLDIGELRLIVFPGPWRFQLRLIDAATNDGQDALPV